MEFRILTALLMLHTALQAQSSRAGQGATNAQVSTPSAVIRVQAPVHGVQLVITSTNCVVSTGATVTIRCMIRNTSTNAIDVVYTGRQELDFESVRLIDQHGKSRELLVRKERYMTMATRRTVNPSDRYESRVTVVLAPDIPAGNYTMRVVRSAGTASRWFLLTSNDLFMRISPTGGGSNATVQEHPDEGAHQTGF